MKPRRVDLGGSVFLSSEQGSGFFVLTGEDGNGQPVATIYLDDAVAEALVDALQTWREARRSP